MRQGSVPPGLVVILILVGVLRQDAQLQMDACSAKGVCLGCLVRCAAARSVCMQRVRAQRVKCMHGVSGEMRNCKKCVHVAQRQGTAIVSMQTQFLATMVGGIVICSPICKFCLCACRVCTKGVCICKLNESGFVVLD